MEQVLDNKTSKSPMKKIIDGFHIFKNAYLKTKEQMIVSVMILILVTLAFSICMFLAEYAINKDYTLWDAFAWTCVKYVEDPSEIAEPPVSALGKIIGTLVGVLGVAIFAVPAGLIGSGLIDAMEKDEREKELISFRKRMRKAFRRENNKSLRTYLNTLPDKGGEDMKVVNVVPQRVTVSKMQVRQGMDFKDIIDTCREFPEFRLKNLADAFSNEKETEDRFVIELFPRNRTYGCYIQRQSNVTIVNTSSFDEVGIGWFTYYLAKIGGFNYISKEVEVDYDELDSFYNLSPEPLYDKKPESAYGPKDKEAISILKKKKKHRKDFLEDLEKVINKENSWVIIVTEHLKTSNNQFDFHFTNAMKDGSQATVNKTAAYQEFLDCFANDIKQVFGLETSQHSLRYPLLKNNLGYKIRETYPSANVFVMRPSSELTTFNDQKLAVAYKIANIMNTCFNADHGILAEDLADLRETGFGYKENDDVDRFYEKD